MNLTKNNSSGFSALPGGYREPNGYFYDIGLSGYWWSATEGNASYAWDRLLLCGFGSLGRYGNYKSCGLSVRLVRDK
jgi:uncharacterized protein (TIGR02145 family)